MIQRRTSGCPLCGANMTARQVLDTRDELLNEELGVWSAHCPYCQGRLEIRLLDDAVELGYLAEGATPRFDVALTLTCPGLKADEAPA